jgi:hypothetical protein
MQTLHAPAAAPAPGRAALPTHRSLPKLPTLSRPTSLPRARGVMAAAIPRSRTSLSISCASGVAHPGEVGPRGLEWSMQLRHARPAALPGARRRGARRPSRPMRRARAALARRCRWQRPHPPMAAPPQEAHKGAQGALPIQMAAPATVMAKGGGDMGSGGSLGMVLERSKVEFVMPTPPQRAPKLDDGGSGGDDGKHNHNGGGGGGDDGGDDDDYFGEGDGEGDGQGGGQGGVLGISLWRAALPELYDKLSIAAVLQEWYRTIAELPLIIRRAVEMGLFSSAQLVRFLSMDCRPNATRAVSRFLPPTVSSPPRVRAGAAGAGSRCMPTFLRRAPRARPARMHMQPGAGRRQSAAPDPARPPRPSSPPQWARDFVGRLMADPAFVQKLVLEQTIMACSSLYYEWSVRGENFKKELDLVLINTVGMMAATGAAVWVSAPSRSFGTVHKFPWQQMLSNLPNNVFDASGPLRQYPLQARAGGFLARMAEMSAIGAITGSVTSMLSQAALAIRHRTNPDWQPSVPLPSVEHAAGGLGAFFAINANLRYQLLGGLDRALFQHTNFLWTYVGLTTLGRAASNCVGELSRPLWQGLPAAGSTEHAPQRQQQQGRIRKVRRKRRAAAGQPSSSSSSSSAADPQLLAAAAVASAAGAEAEAAPAYAAAAAGEEAAAHAAPLAEEVQQYASYAEQQQQEGELLISHLSGEVVAVDIAAATEPLVLEAAGAAAVGAH